MAYLEEILPHIRAGRRAKRKDCLTDLSANDKYLEMSAEDLLADDWELVPDPKKFKRLAYLWSDGNITFENVRWFIEPFSATLVETREIEWSVE